MKDWEGKDIDAITLTDAQKEELAAIMYYSATITNVYELIEDWRHLSEDMVERYTLHVAEIFGKQDAIQFKRMLVLLIAVAKDLQMIKEGRAK